MAERAVLMHVVPCKIDTLSWTRCDSMDCRAACTRYYIRIA